LGAFIGGVQYMLKAKSKAKRIGNVVTLDYKNANLTFNWEHDVLSLAQDLDGEVWAFNSLEVQPTSALGGTWCHANEKLFKTSVSKFVTTMPVVNNWAMSLVEYKL
jgi:hypothetical protein